MNGTSPEPDAELLKRAAEVLDPLREVEPGAPREARWRTTEQLASELGLYSGNEIDHLEAVLHAHAEGLRNLPSSGGTKGLVERAKYPDRTTALPLWGPVRDDAAAHAGRPAERIDMPEPVSDALRVPDGAPRVFLSHTHRDAALSHRVAESLAVLGIGSWRFETHIEQRGPIANCVRRAIESSAGVVGLVTRTSVASLWVLTELHTAMRQQKAVALIVDAADHELLELLLTADFVHPDEDFDLSVRYSAALASSLNEHYAEWESPTRAIRYRSQLDAFLASLPFYLGTRANLQSPRVWRPALAFPNVPVNTPTGFVQLAPLSELPARLAFGS